jgi:uncharacterized protein YprB with RNaseH-like and TPR domain
MDLLQRLARARTLEHLESPPEPRAPAPPSSASPFVRRELVLSLCPAPAGPRGFGAARSDRPALLGGCLDRLELPARAALARDLVCIGAAGGGRAVFLDTETTGLGGASVAFVVGLAWYEGDTLRVGQWTLSRLGGEAEMLADVFASLQALGPDPLLSFNGASFDLPLLRLRARRYGLASAALEGDHVDLLHPARRLHKHRQKARGRDCRLGTLERELLGLRRRGDIDSAEIPAVFWDWLREPECPRARRRLDAVCEHNLVDLVSLPALASRLAQLVRAPDDLERARGAARHLLRLGAEQQARTLLARWVEPGLPASVGGPSSKAGPGPRDRHWREAALELATLERRAGARQRAARLWCAAWIGDPGCPVASEAWAKHLEHHERDFAEALCVARASRLPCERRIARLEQRLARARAAAGATRAPSGQTERDPHRAALPANGEVASARSQPPKPQPKPAAPELRATVPELGPVPRLPVARERGSELLSVVEDERGARLRYRLLR